MLFVEPAPLREIQSVDAVKFMVRALLDRTPDSVPLADLFIYALDRVVLGLFRPAATVGLYEGPVRAHNVVRQVRNYVQQRSTLAIVPGSSEDIIN